MLSLCNKIYNTFNIIKSNIVLTTSIYSSTGLFFTCAPFDHVGLIINNWLFEFYISASNVRLQTVLTATCKYLVQ